MDDPQVKRHWIICAWTAPDDEHPFGITDAPYFVSYGTVDEAKDQARTLAALNAGKVYVVYCAQWYAFTDPTPVNLLHVIGATTT